MHRDLVPIIAQRLSERDQTLGCAESCTGGLLSAKLVAFPGISQIFNGSIVAYSNRIKHLMLGVPESVLRTNGAVSSVVAVKMAVGAKKVLGSDWALSITGIAGPSGGSRSKPVGLVYFAVVGPGVELWDVQQFKGERVEVQKQSAEHALQLLWQELNRGD